MGAPMQRLLDFVDSHDVPAGSPTITARSFTELCAGGVGVAADVSPEFCPNAFPHANALTNTPAINNLVITPPREFFVCSHWIARRDRPDNPKQPLAEKYRWPG